MIAVDSADRARQSGHHAGTQIIVDTVTHFEVVTPADSGPAACFRAHMDRPDEDADPKPRNRNAPGSGRPTAPPPAPAPRAPEPAVNDNGTKVPRNGSLGPTEEPVWLYADEDYGASFSARPRTSMTKIRYLAHHEDE